MDGKLRYIESFMDTKEIIEGLMPDDRHNVVPAAWAIIHSNDTQMLSAVSDALPVIATAVNHLPPNSEPAFRDYRFAPALAVPVLTCFKQADSCRCSLYPASNGLDPEKEQRLGFIKIIKEEDHLEEYRVEYTCICAHGETHFETILDESYPYPLWYWKRVDRPLSGS